MTRFAFCSTFALACALCVAAAQRSSRVDARSGAETGEERPSAREEVRRIAKLRGESQVRALQEMVESLRGMDGEDFDGYVQALFDEEPAMRASWRVLIRHPESLGLSAQLVSLFGIPAEVERMVEAGPHQSDKEPDDGWVYAVVCGLLEPQSERAWAMLERAASGGYNDGWADRGAIQTLRLIASPRSRKILLESAETNPKCKEMIAQAVEYIDSGPRPLEDARLQALAERVARASPAGKLLEVGEARFNRAQDKALVEVYYRNGIDLLTYTATFHRMGSVWKLRGFRETKQAMMPPSIPPPRPQGE